jgi:hypothetical protein
MSDYKDELRRDKGKTDDWADAGAAEAPRDIQDKLGGGKGQTNDWADAGDAASQDYSNEPAGGGDPAIDDVAGGVDEFVDIDPKQGARDKGK